jgi:uncharacterized protein
MNPYLSVVIKPTMACNLDCKHCYHEPEERVPGCITLDKLDKLFRLVSQEYESAWFIWHGGEPMLLSLQFYKDAISLQSKYFGKGTHRVGNTIQTNGTLIDRKFANFCRDNQINIGVSFEGPYDDVLRQKADVVDRNLEYLSKREHVFSVNSTISSDTVDKQAELYRYFRERDINISFSPVIQSGCAAKEKSLVPNVDDYISESIKMFDEWLFDKDSDVPLIPHYLYLLNALGESVESDCAHDSCLTKWICIYPNGDIYPCAKACPEDFLLTNIKDVEHINDVFMTEGFRRILIGTIERRIRCKVQCEFFDNCNGGCSIDAFYQCGIGNPGGDSCRIFKAVFGHVKDVSDHILTDKPDLFQYNKYVRDAIIGKLVNPKIINM